MRLGVPASILRRDPIRRGRQAGSNWATEPSTIVNTLISYAHESGNWQIDAYVKNLFDKRLPTFKLEIDNLAGTRNGQVNYNARRTAAVTFTYRF